MRKRFDVLGLGCTAMDEILYVAEHPRADSKVEIRWRERHCGGLCATALVAAARLGARCAYAGTLGPDAASRFILQTLESEGIDARQVVWRRDARPVHSVIIVDETRRTRTILYDATQAGGADPRFPPASLILSARVLLVDRFGLPGMIRAARIARKAGIAVVADFESTNGTAFRALVNLADHLIVSKDFASRFTGAATAPSAVARLWREDRAAVIVTCGEEGGWYLTKGQKKAKHFPAFRVKAMDTTGCGDVFHGAYAAALANGLALEERLRFAAAAAAIKATGRGGQNAIPKLAELRQILRGKC